MDYHAKMINSIKEAGQKLIDDAEKICEDAETAFLQDIDIDINISFREESTMSIHKNYAIEKTNANTIYLGS